jgi:hypothetical protein
MQMAGTAYAKGDEASAKRHKQTAADIRMITPRPNGGHTIEATYEWIAALVKFSTENATMRGHLEGTESNVTPLAEPE